MSKSAASYEILRHLRPLYQASSRIVTGLLADLPMTLPLRAVVELIEQDGQQTVPQLAASMLVTRQGTQKIVNEGVALGILRLGENPAHRRSRLVGVTDEGWRAFATLRRREDELLETVAVSIETARLEQAAAVIEQLTAAMRDAVEPIDRADREPAERGH